MVRYLISSGSTFESKIGYSRAVVDGDLIFVSGTTGFNYAKMTISEDVVVQCAEALRNIENALKEAGATLSDVVRVRYILPNRDDWPLCWLVVSDAFRDVRPAATMFVAELQDPRMKIEIEVTARISS